MPTVEPPAPWQLRPPPVRTASRLGGSERLAPTAAPAPLPAVRRAQPPRSRSQKQSAAAWRRSSYSSFLLSAHHDRHTPKAPWQPLYDLAAVGDISVARPGIIG